MVKPDETAGEKGGISREAMNIFHTRPAANQPHSTSGVASRPLNWKIGGAGLIADRGYLKLFHSGPLAAGLSMAYN